MSLDSDFFARVFSAGSLFANRLRATVFYMHGVVLLLLVIGSSGCSLLFDDNGTSDDPATAETESPPEPQPTPEPEEEAEAKEVAPAKAVTASTPEGDLIRAAEKLYQAGMFSLAKESFQSLRDQYPLGAYAPLAEIKLADAYFYNREFVEAAKKYDEFAKSHPASADVPYVKLQAARSLLRASRGLGRDRGPLERALTLLDSIVQEYPQSAYANLADDERRKVAEDLSSYDQMIIEFYEKRENKAAVEARTKLYKERWSARLSQKPLASARDQRLTCITSPSLKTTLGMGTPSNPPIAVDAIPTSTLAVDSRAQGSEIGAAATDLTRDSQEDTAADSSVAKAGSAKPLPLQLAMIERVTCRDKGAPFALIELSKELRGAQGGGPNTTLEPEDGLVRLSGYALQSTQKSFDCFGVGDLQISAENELQIATEKSVTVTTLSNPFRLILVPENS